VVIGQCSLVTGPLVTGHCVLVLVTGHQSLVISHWSLITGHWSLVTWSLVTDH